MSVNVLELRKSAYRLWGLRPQRVIYDFPDSRRTHNPNFIFRLDYAEENASWPRAYVMSIGDQPPILRVVSPIVVMESYDALQIDKKAWYDMPYDLHGKIVQMTSKNNIKRPLKLWKKIINYLLPQNKKFTGVVDVENYIFVVSSFNNDLIIQAI